MLWLIMAATHTARDVPITNGRQRRMTRLEPGQLSFSVRFLAEKWAWSDKRVQRFLSALEDDRSVTTQTTTGQTVITLCNWRKYQRPNSDVPAQTTTQMTTQATTQTTTKNNELKEFKELKAVAADARATDTQAAIEEPPAVSAEKRLAIELGLTFLNALGFEDYAAAPPAYYSVPQIAEKWACAGYSREMIAGEAKRVFDRQGAPRSPRFFDNIFAEAHARLARPLPSQAARAAGDGIDLQIGAISERIRDTSVQIEQAILEIVEAEHAAVMAEYAANCEQGRQLAARIHGLANFYGEMGRTLRGRGDEDAAFAYTRRANALAGVKLPTPGVNRHDIEAAAQQWSRRIHALRTGA